jgi:hypothetical protein
VLPALAAVDDAWGAVFMPSTVQDEEREWWVADRLAGNSKRERVIEHALVQWLSGISQEEEGAKRNEGVVALTGDFVYAFETVQDSVPQLVWRRPYRAVTRLVRHSCVVHMEVSRGDFYVGENDHLVMVCASSGDAQALCSALVRLNGVWQAAEIGMSAHSRRCLEEEDDVELLKILKSVAVGARNSALVVVADYVRLLGGASGAASTASRRDMYACLCADVLVCVEVNDWSKWRWPANEECEREALARRFRVENASVLASLSEFEQGRGEAAYVNQAMMQRHDDDYEEDDGSLLLLRDPVKYLLQDIVEARFADVRVDQAAWPCVSLVFITMNKAQTQTYSEEITLVFMDDTTREVWRRALLPALGGLVKEKGRGSSSRR